MQRLSYSDELHEYRVDGIVVPSVTQIVEAVTGKDVSRVPPKILQAARERGIEIHKDIENGTLLTEEGQWIEKQIDRSKCQFEVQGFAEIDGLVFAGTCDILSDAETENAEIIDTKTVYARDVLYWTLQDNMYRKIFGAQKLSVAWTPKSGNYERVTIAVLSDEKMSELVSAYRSGRILDDSFISAPVEHEEISLDLVVYEKDIGKLTTNAQAILEAVNRKLESYKPENYSEDNIAEAKKDKAALNNSAKLLDDKRIEIEKEWNKPLDQFKNTVKQAVTAIKTASGQIDVIVKDVENRVKDDRKKQLKAFFDGLKCELVTFDKIFRESWFNKTTKVKDAEGEIFAAVEKIEADLAILDRIGEPDARAHYLLTLNLESALAKADEIKAAKARLAKVEAARAAYVAPVVPQPVFQPFSQPVQQPSTHVQPVSVAVAEQPEILERTMKVFATYDQLVWLSEQMNEKGIKFQKL